MDVTTNKKVVVTVAELTEQLNDAYAALCVLEARLPNRSKVKKPGRKDQVLAILNREGHITVFKIAEELGINAKNVSCQLHYLRASGYAIGTDSKGRKFIEAD